MGFLDEVVITARSGHGGRGCISFRREKYIPKGGPDGGDGGRGGSVFVRASEHRYTLDHYVAQRRFAARNGEPGGGNGRTGKSGDDLILEVPLGTVVEDADTGVVLADLTRHGQDGVLLPGGKGGKGNRHFATAVNRTPRYAQQGLPGVEKTLRLSLKFLADIGIVGLPNAGKSTLLRCLSTARPKVGDYPFTTLHPNLGVMQCDHDRHLVVADIPGLIGGASVGRGLGHRFLKHIERTRMLLHVLDLAYIPDKDPLEDYHIVRSELSAFHPALAQKPGLVVINKTDLDPPTRRDGRELAEALEAIGIPFLWISALKGEGIFELKKAIIETWTTLPETGS